MASNTFYRLIVHQFSTNCNVPLIIHEQDSNIDEVDKLLHNAYLRTPLFFKNLVKDFLDPSGQDRTPVVLNMDGTYINIEGSNDIELQKYMFYAPRASHVA